MKEINILTEMSLYCTTGADCNIILIVNTKVSYYCYVL